MKVATRRLLKEQIAVVVVLESGKKDDAMWHVPQLFLTCGKQVRVLTCRLRGFPDSVHQNVSIHLVVHS